MKLSTEEKSSIKNMVDVLMPRLERSDFEAINEYFIKLRDNKHSFSIRVNNEICGSCIIIDKKTYKPAVVNEEGYYHGECCYCRKPLNHEGKHFMRSYALGMELEF
jgi:hypothetical protein